MFIYFYGKLLSAQTNFFLSGAHAYVYFYFVVTKACRRRVNSLETREGGPVERLATCNLKVKHRPTGSPITVYSLMGTLQTCILGAQQVSCVPPNPPPPPHPPQPFFSSSTVRSWMWEMTEGVEPSQGPCVYPPDLPPSSTRSERRTTEQGARTHAPTVLFGL